MGRRATQPVLGAAKKLKVKLTDELAADLWAFCEIHHGAPHNRVIEKALRKFITDDLEKHPTLHNEWRQVREQITQPRTAPQLIRFPDSGSQDLEGKKL